METKQTHAAGCCGPGRKNKNFWIVLGLILLMGFLALIAFEASGKFARSGMMYGYDDLDRNGKGVYFSSYVNDQFVLPQDAAKSGELAIIVDNLDAAKQAVSDIAVKEGGIIYSTFIAYSSEKIKNGSVVVQVPAEKFDVVFEALKYVGKQVVQESSRQIPHVNVFPVAQSLPEAAVEVSNDSAAAEKSDENAEAQEDAKNGSSEIAALSSDIAMPAYYAPYSQDKGYIRVVFADYGRRGFSGGMMSAMGVFSGGGILGVGYGGLGMRDNAWVVFGVKSILLIVLVFILVAIIRKIYKDIRRARHIRLGARQNARDVKREIKSQPAKKRPIVHVVRQASRTRSRVVRIAKKR